MLFRSDGGGRGLLLNGWESDRKASNLEPNQSFTWAALLVCLPGGGCRQQSTGTEKEADDPSGRQGHPLGVGIYLAATVLRLGSRILPPASCFLRAQDRLLPHMYSRNPSVFTLKSNF